MTKPIELFFNSAPQYYADGDLLSRKENTLSLDAANRVVKAIGNAHPAPIKTVCDIAGGTGYFSILLSRKMGSARCVVLDKSGSMLSVGSAYVRDHPHSSSVCFVQGDAHRLPLQEGTTDCALIFCAMHLLDIGSSLREASRVLARGGQLYILTWKPEDLAKTIYHRFFPSYIDFDLPRYNFVANLPNELAQSGFRLIDVQHINSRLEYETPEEAVALARSRPFSTFHFYNPKAFEAGLHVYSAELIRAFGRGPVINLTSMSLFIASKN